jgi:hypothetical protein
MCTRIQLEAQRKKMIIQIKTRETNVDCTAHECLGNQLFLDSTSMRRLRYHPAGHY